MKNSEMPTNPVYNKHNEAKCVGLTKREYFAGLAMQSFCGSPDYFQTSPEAIAAIAVEQADALLNQLDGETK